MSNQIDFPTKPFYIMSKINRSNWVLTVTEKGAVVLQALTSTVDQIWTATPDPRGGAILRHVGTGLVLACSVTKIFGMQIPGGPLKAVNLDTADSTQLWRAEDLGDNWCGINTLLNWEGKINVYGSNVHGTIGIFHWDGGADNEEWRLVTELGEVTVDSVDYDMTKAVADLGMPPSHCAITTVDNTLGGKDVSSTYSLARTVTTQRSITTSESNTTGHKYTQTFSIKGGIEKVVEVSASASFEESDSKTISLTDQKTNTETVTDTISTQVSVPAGKKYAYHVVVYYGKVSVPYTAHMTFQSSTVGAKPVKLTTQGIFTGVNKTNNEIVVRDITSAQPDKQKLVESLAVA